MRAQGIFVPPDVEAAASKAVNALERIREVEVTALVDRASFEEIVTETNRTVLRVNELRKQLSDRNQGPGAFFLGDDRRSEQYLVETEAKLDALREALSRKKLADAEEERKAKIDAERERIRISNADFDNRLAKIRREKDAAREAARALEAPAIKLPPAAQEVVISAQLSPEFNRTGAAQAVDVSSDSRSTKRRRMGASGRPSKRSGTFSRRSSRAWPSRSGKATRPETNWSASRSSRPKP